MPPFSLAGQKKCSEALPFLLEGYQGMVAHKEQTGATTPIANFLLEIDLTSPSNRFSAAWNDPSTPTASASEWSDC